MTTQVNMTSGKVLKVRGSFNEVCEGFKAKGAVLSLARMNDNMIIHINGICVGQIVKD